MSQLLAVLLLAVFVAVASAQYYGGYRAAYPAYGGYGYSGLGYSGLSYGGLGYSGYGARAIYG